MVISMDEEFESEDIKRIIRVSETHEDPGVKELIILAYLQGKIDAMLRIKNNKDGF